MSARLASVIIEGSSTAWTAVGFDADGDGRIGFSNGALEFVAGTTPRLLGLSVDGVDDLADSLAGIPLTAGTPSPAGIHPNGCFELDHLVVLTPDIDLTSLEVGRVLGLERKRMRETATVRQAFHRFDRRGCILELVESERVASPRLFGLVANTPELEAVCADLGPDLIGAAKPAVQPRRMIATFRSAAGLGIPVALMTPER